MSEHPITGLWLQYVLGFGNTDHGRVLAEAHDVGADGILVHAVGASKPALDWIAKLCAFRYTQRVAVAIGSRGPSRWDTALANPALNALRAGFPVTLDAEGAWDGADGEPAARKVVDKILAAVTDAPQRMSDQAWWAPDLHSRFPIRTFGLVCGRRFPQCYGTVGSSGMQRDGDCARMLVHARRQYALRHSMPDAVFPTVRGYARSSADACALLLAEPTQIVYVGSAKPANTLSPDVRRGLLAARKIRSAGFSDAAAWQRASGLVADGIVGPRSMAALGL